MKSSTSRVVEFGTELTIEDLVTLQDMSATSISFEKIVSAPAFCLINTQFTTMRLTSLRDIDGFFIDGENLVNLKELSMPLYSVGTLSIINSLQLQTISLPNLAVMGGMTLSNMAFQTLVLPAEELTDNAQIMNNNFVSSVSFPNLRAAWVDIELDSLPALERLDLPKAEYIWSLNVTNTVNLNVLSICSLRVLNGHKFSDLRHLSCYDTLAVLTPLSDAFCLTDLVPPACNDVFAGQFGCQFNATLPVNATTCSGNSVACIQAQIDLAVDNQGLSVFVPAGTYTGCAASGALSLGGKRITLFGAGLDQTIIDCQGVGRALVFQSGESTDSAVIGIGFKNGAAATGGLVLITGGSSPTITDCSFTGGTASIAGGALYISGASSPTLLGVTISSSSAPVGGGLAVSGATLSATRLSLMNNLASGEGGGVSIQGVVGPAPTFVEITLTGNTGARGGGLFIDAAMTIANATVRDNSAAQFGGGLALVPTDPLRTHVNISDGTFENNEASTGGGIYSFSANLALRDSSLNNNHATGDAGGVYASCSENYRFLYSVDGACDVHVMFSHVSLTHNTAGGAGGGVSFQDVYATIYDANLCANRATQGGAVSASATVLSISVAVITDNQVSSLGGAVYCEPLAGSCDISVSNLDGNFALVAGGAVYLCVTACPGSSTTPNTTTTAADYSLLAYGSLPALQAPLSGNTFARNSVGPEGYGVDVAADPAHLTWLTPPPDSAISGRSMVTATAIAVSVTDWFNQTVTKSSSLLAVSLFTFLPNGQSATNWAAVAGSQTVLATNGVARFGGVSIVASHAEYVNVLYHLTARLSPFTSVTVSRPIMLLPCAPGQGKAPDATAIACDDCGAGTAGSGTGEYNCAPCLPGTFSQALASACTPCPVNTAAQFGSASTCVACQAGFTAPVGSAECVSDGALAATTNLVTALGASLGVLLIIGLIVAAAIYRLARKRTMQKYYLDNDSTVRTGAIESTLQRNVKKMILAASTTRVGGGIYADIYKARYENRWIALKVLRGDMIGNATALKEFQRETIALNRINERGHSGIFTLQFFLTRNPMCIGLEYCSGGTVKAALAGAMKFETKVRLAAETASGMSVLHALGIAHLDLKTDNLLLTEDLHVKLADFGISRTLGSDTTSMPQEYINSTAGRDDDDEKDDGGASVNVSSRRSSAHVSAVNPVFDSALASGATDGDLNSIAPPPPPTTPPPGSRPASAMFSAGGIDGAGANRSVNRTSSGAPPGLSSAGSRPMSGLSHADVLAGNEDDTAFTPQYVDPVRLTADRPKDIDFLCQSDVYSFAMIMWTLYGQVEPYAGEAPAAVQVKLTANPMLRPPELEGCPEFYRSLMHACWSADRGARPSFRAILATLKEALGTHFSVILLPAYAQPNDTSLSR